MLLSTLARDSLFDLKDAGAVTKTIDEYDRVYRQFQAYLIRIGRQDDARAFTGDTCEGFYRDLAAQGIKASTIRHKLSALSTLAKYGLRTKGLRGRAVLTENPTLTFRWPRAQRPRQDFLYPDELRAFLAVQRPAYESIPRDLFVDTGLRRAELAHANVEDFVKLPSGYALWTAVKGRGRQQERVPIPISSVVGDAVHSWLDVRPQWAAKGPEPLLVDRQGRRWRDTTLGEVMARIGKLAGITRITVYPHRLRRTANIVARHAGLDSLTRSALLNHTDPGTIRQYDAVIPGELADAREKAAVVGLARYLGRGAT